MSNCGGGRGRGRLGGSPAAPSLGSQTRPTIPPAEWTVSGQTRWSTPSASLNPPGYTWLYRWSTPVFDLRPDLLSQVGNSKQGFQIWDTAARLYISLNGPNAGSFDGRTLSALATNFISVFDANVQAGAGSAPGSSPAPNLIRLGTEDVSSVFYPVGTQPGLGNVLGGFAPPITSLGGGEGYPVRYWRLRIFFTFFVPEVLPLPPNPTPPAPLVIRAGMY